MLQTLQIAVMLLGAFGLGYLFKLYLNDSLKKQVNDLNAQVDSLSTRLSWSEDEKNKLTATLAKANLDLISSKNELTEKQNALLSAQAESEQLQAKAESLELENALAAETMASLKEQLQNDNSVSTEQMDRIERLHAELNKIKTDNAVLTSEKERLNSTLNELKLKIEAAENNLALTNTETEAERANFELMQEENDLAMEAINGLKEQAQLNEITISDQITKIEQLQGELNRMKEEKATSVSEAQLNFGKLDEENTTLRNDLTELEMQLDTLSAEVEQNKMHILALQNDNGELLVEIMALEDNAGQTLANNDEFEAKMVQLQNEKAALERSVTELINENEEMMARMASLYEKEVVETEAHINPVQIEDEVEIEQHHEIAAPITSEAEVTTFATSETEMDSEDVIPDDLKVIEGIGPKIQELLYNSGIKTFSRLSTTPVEHIRRILVLAGDRFAVHDPKSWPEQAVLAANNQWDELQKFQANLAAEAEKTESKS